MTAYRKALRSLRHCHIPASPTLQKHANKDAGSRDTAQREDIGREKHSNQVFVVVNARKVCNARLVLLSSSFNQLLDMYSTYFLARFPTLVVSHLHNMHASFPYPALRPSLRFAQLPSQPSSCCTHSAIFGHRVFFSLSLLGFGMSDHVGHRLFSSLAAWSIGLRE